MAVKKLKDFLDQHHIKYAIAKHSPAYTSQEIAACAHVSGRQLAKVVMVKIDGKLTMIVLPAHDQVDFSKLRNELHAKEVDLASEMEFKDKFPGCEVGAMPIFGNLYDMPVVVTYALTKQNRIMFNAGTHAELIQLLFADFERLAKPKIIA